MITRQQIEASVGEDPVWLAASLGFPERFIERGLSMLDEPAYQDHMPSLSFERVVGACSLMAFSCAALRAKMIDFEAACKLMEGGVEDFEKFTPEEVVHWLSIRGESDFSVTRDLVDLVRAATKLDGAPLEQASNLGQRFNSVIQQYVEVPDYSYEEDAYGNYPAKLPTRADWESLGRSLCLISHVTEIMES